MPSTGATGTKWYCEASPLAEPVLLPRSGLSINPHLKWGSLTRALLKEIHTQLDGVEFSFEICYPDMKEAAECLWHFGYLPEKKSALLYRLDMSDITALDGIKEDANAGNSTRKALLFPSCL